MSDRTVSRSGFVAVWLAAALGGACAPARHAPDFGAAPAAPSPMLPDGPRPGGDGAAEVPRPAPDLTEPGAVAWGVTEAEIIDTRAFPVQVQETETEGPPRTVRQGLPDHPKSAPVPRGVPNELVPGVTLGEELAEPERQFAALTNTGWNPPDPTLAVGPNHVLTTVNQSLAWYSKAGALQFSAPLNASGNPGFFEGVGAGGFTFDPRCLFDQHAQRFVVLALETYGETQEAYITIAISDDADPNGVWYKYRTDAVLTVGATTYWWDFPGLGCDQNAWYVTGNLFGLSASGFAGAGFRVFQKPSMLTGGAAQHATLRDGASSTVQAAHHYGTPGAAFFVSHTSSTSLRLHAIRDAATAPTLASVSVAVPSSSNANDAPCEGGTVTSGGGSILGAVWRAGGGAATGRLYTAHNSSRDGRNVARWYEIATNSWPASGSPVLLQSGDADAGPDVHTLFPALAVNAAGEIGMVYGVTKEGGRVGVAVTGRRPTDPAGRMGAATTVKAGEGANGGRWGDYFAACVDPANDSTFWFIGEYKRTSGWGTWVGSFSVGATSLAHAIPDDLGVAIDSAPRVLDALANDYHSTGAALTISGFDATSARGGTITRSVGSGPGGRDRLLYTPPASLVNATDTFSYTVTGAGASDTGYAIIRLYNPATFRTPDAPARVQPGVDVAWYALTAPETLPDFSAVGPYATSSLSNINIASTTGVFSTSTRADNVGGVFTGYIEVPRDDLYTLSTNSDDGSALWIGAVRVVDNDGLHGMRERSGVIGLKAGRHAARVDFFEGTSGAGLIVSIAGTLLPKQVIPASMWSRPAPPPPCRPDVDGSGLVTVDDIFSFLGLWFDSNPAADFDGSGGTPEVADIFAFLAAWFAGC